MAINIDNFQSQPIYTGLPIIKVIGVGGGGGNVVNRMINDQIKGVQYVSANTDIMVLNSSKADVTIPIGSQITKGLGAGMNPEVGKLAAEEDIETIRSVLENTDLLFIAAGMGGGTGTGAAPVIAEIAKEMRILTVGIVTTPFKFEGTKRAKIAEKGIAELRKHVDTLMVVPNNKLLEIASKKTTMNQAFVIADDVLKQAIGGITHLINLEGIINLDFADLKTVMANKGRAIMGTGIGNGEQRGVEAARKAVSSPLLNDKPISGATGVIINIVADENFSLLDAQEAAELIQNSADEDADVIFGLVTDPTKEDEVVITVIATGFDDPNEALESDTFRNQPLRVVDSLKHRAPLTDIDDSNKHQDDEVALNTEERKKEDVVELDPEKIGLKAVEDELHYPNGSVRKLERESSEDDNLKNLGDLDVPSFMRKKRFLG